MENFQKHTVLGLLEALRKKLKPEKEILVLAILEDAYIGGRYLLREYSKEERELVFKFVEKIFKKYGFMEKTERR